MNAIAIILKMKTTNKQIVITHEGKEYEGEYSVLKGMISVNSIYGSSEVWGTTVGRAKETLREVVIKWLQEDGSRK